MALGESVRCSEGFAAGCYSYGEIAAGLSAAAGAAAVSDADADRLADVAGGETWGLPQIRSWLSLAAAAELEGWSCVNCAAVLNAAAAE